MTGSANRREFLAGAISLGAAWALGEASASAFTSVDDPRSLIAITLDLEMSRHYPTRDQTHWGYEKGNLDAERSWSGIPPNGFRTPSGFSDGLVDRPDLQERLLKLGFDWVSSKVRQAGERAALVDLGTMAQRARRKSKS